MSDISDPSTVADQTMNCASEDTMGTCQSTVQEVKSVADCELTSPGGQHHDATSDHSLKSTKAPSIIKNRGSLSYKKRGPFAKWKQHYVVLDEEKLQMSFYKSAEEHDRLASCKLSVDLRFIENIVPSRPGLMKRRSAFKLFRRAGLSTLNMATDSPEDRAKWITTLDNLLDKLRSSPERDSVQKFATLPARSKSQTAEDQDTDSDHSKTASVPEGIQIPPRKLSRPGFQVDTRQISSIKLRRISSETTKEQEPETPIAEDRSSQTSFGVTLKKVDMEEIKNRRSKEKIEEVPEFKVKYSSLSRPRSRSPNIPLSDKLKSSKGDVSVTNSPTRLITSTPVQRSGSRKRSLVTNIPLSDSVKTVMKHNHDAETLQITLPEQEEAMQTSLTRKGSRICHATTTEIQTFECEVTEIEGSKSTPEPVEDSMKSCEKPPSIIYTRSQSINSESSDKTLVGNSPSDVSDTSSLDPIPYEIKIESEDDKEVEFDYSADETTVCKLEESRVVCEAISVADKNAETGAIESDKDSFEKYADETEINDNKSEKNVIKQSASLWGELDIPVKEKLKPASEMKAEEVSRSSDVINSLTEQSRSPVVSSDEEIAEQIGEQMTNVIMNETLSELSQGTGERNSSKIHCNVENVDNITSCEAADEETSLTDTTNESSNIDSTNAETTDSLSSDPESSLSSSFDSNLSGQEDQREDVYPKSCDVKPEIEKPPRLDVQISISNENDEVSILDESQSSPVIHRRSGAEILCKEQKEIMALKRPSNMSVMSSESDDPLPRFNFLGRSDRSSGNSPFYRDQFSIDEEDFKTSKIEPRKTHSLVQFESSNETESSKLVGLASARISYIEVLDFDQLKVSSSEDVVEQLSPKNQIETVTSQNETTQPLVVSEGVQGESCATTSLLNSGGNFLPTQQEEDEFENIEKDYFPSYEVVDHRLKDLSNKEANILRTSGIQGLKEYLATINMGGSNTEGKTGVNRLGSSVAVEKLREEL